MSQSLSSALNAWWESRRGSSNALHVQAGRFTVAGLVSAGVDFGVTWLLQMVLGLGGITSRTVGWALGTLLAYAINQRWTFGARASTKRFGQTMLLYGVTYVVNIGLYRLAFPLFDAHLNTHFALLGAFVVAQAVATVINFLVQRLLIFRAR